MLLQRFSRSTLILRKTVGPCAAVSSSRTLSYFKNIQPIFPTPKLSLTANYPSSYSTMTEGINQLPPPNRAKNVFITGANSGIGFELVKQMLALGAEHVFATYRNPARSEELLELAKVDSRVQPLHIDVRNDCMFCRVLKQVYAIVGEDGINLLINNAGIFTERQGLCELNKKSFMEFLEVNTVAPVLLVKELLPLLEKASTANPDSPMGIEKAVVANITSSYGSIGANTDGGFYYSRCCRAALNAASKNLSLELQEQKILVVAISPGWVRTEQGGPKAPLSPQESVAGMVQVLTNLDESKNGSFIDYAGTLIPW